MKSLSIHPKLSHLTQQQIDELINRYYAGENVRALIQEFGTNCPINQFTKLLPPLIDHSSQCAVCGSPMMKVRVSRSSHLLGAEPIRCSSCGHTGAEYCTCEFCKDQRQKQQLAHLEKRRALVAEYCRVPNLENTHDLKVENLSLDMAVALLALVRTCGYMDKTNGHVLESFQNATIPFAPNGSYGDALRDFLLDSGLINISNHSRLDSFVFEGDEITGYYPSRVRWEFLFGNPGILIQQIEECALLGTWPEEWKMEVLDQCWDLAFAECMEFYEHAARQRGLMVSGEQSIKAMLSNLLADFSVAQCYHIIYSGARAAADFMVRTKSTKPHASNYMIGACQRWADRARAESWDVSGYRRNFDLPRSMVSYVLHDVFTKMGERSFTTIFHKSDVELSY